MQRKRVDYFYSIFNIFVYNYEYSRNPPHPSTFLISSTLCHSTSIASSAWVMCLLSAYQKIVLLLSETGEKIQLSCLGILYVGIAHTFKTTYHSLKEARGKAQGPANTAGAPHFLYPPQHTHTYAMDRN